jgi:hypothetical protein
MAIKFMFFSKELDEDFVVQVAMYRKIVHGTVKKNRVKLHKSRFGRSENPRKP